MTVGLFLEWDRDGGRVMVELIVGSRWNDEMPVDVLWWVEFFRFGREILQKWSV